MNFNAGLKKNKKGIIMINIMSGFKGSVVASSEF